MNTFTPFDPVANPIGTIRCGGVNNGEQIILFNSSLSCLQLTFRDQTKDTLPPGWVRTWSKEGPITTIDYSTLFTLPLAGQPISTLYGTIYEKGEHIAEVNGPIQYVVSGEQLTTQFVNNTKYAAGTVFIFAAASTDTSQNGAVSLNNIGQLVLGDPLFNGSVAVITGGSSSSITLDNNGFTISNLSSSVYSINYNGQVNLPANATFFVAVPSGGWSRRSETLIIGTGNGSFACPALGYDIALPTPCTNSGSTQAIGISKACPSVITTSGGLGWRILTVTA